jgi:hypothetical protein
MFDEKAGDALESSLLLCLRAIVTAPLFVKLRALGLSIAFFRSFQPHGANRLG